MEKQQINQTVRKPSSSDSRKNCLFVVAAICLLLIVGLAVSAALLGGSLGRFSEAETNVIPLIPPKSTGGENTVVSGTEASETIAGGSAASPRSTGERTAAPTVEYRGELDIYDGQQIWGSETQVDLFRSSYGDTVVSGDGEKVIAPGTSNYYRFTLKNNGNIPLDYTVSLKVDTYYADRGTASAIPLEWRLLNGNGTAVTDWQGYNDRTQTLKKSTLDARRQNGYTIQWRWEFDRDEIVDRVDTELGVLAEKDLLGVKATITVVAEQSASWDGKPSDDWWIPKTGDPFNLLLYVAVLTISACGLLILFVMMRRRNKDEDNKHGGEKT